VSGLADLSAADLADCVALFVATFAAPPWEETWEPADAHCRLEDFHRTPRSHGVTLRDGTGLLLGFALGHRERFGPDDHFLLKEMCVRAAVQGIGHGSTLLGGLTARMPDVSHWHLLTARDSPAAGFYARHGFRPAGRIGLFVRP